MRFNWGAIFAECIIGFGSNRAASEALAPINYRPNNLLYSLAIWDTFRARILIWELTHGRVMRIIYLTPPSPCHHLRIWRRSQCCSHCRLLFFRLCQKFHDTTMRDIIGLHLNESRFIRIYLHFFAMRSRPQAFLRLLANHWIKKTGLISIVVASGDG